MSRHLGRLRNDDGDGNENGKKAVGLNKRTTSMHLYRALLYISLPSFHDGGVKLPNFTFCGGRELKTTTLF